MEMRSGPKVSGRSRRVAADQGWSLRGVPLYLLPILAWEAKTYPYKDPEVQILIASKASLMLMSFEIHGLYCICAEI